MYPIWIVYLVIAFATAISFLDNAMYFKSLQTERDKHQLEYAVNSASDAAVQRMQDTSQLTPTGNIYIDPEHIWDTYKYTFLRSNNLWSESNMEKVETSFPSVVIAVNDGYYMRLLVDAPSNKNENGVLRYDKDYRFTQKIPFARTTQTNTPGVITTGNVKVDIPPGSVVADTMDGSNIVVYSEPGGNPSYSIYQHDGNTLEHKIGSAHDLVDINRMLLEAIDYTMFYNSSRSGSQQDQAKLAIPDEVSRSLLSPSVNFVGPTIFAFSDNFNLKGKSYFNYYSVGGSQIVQASNYYAYIRDGQKYYSRLNPERFKGSAQSTIIQIYSNAKEAAEAGYEPDPYYY